MKTFHTLTRKRNHTLVRKISMALVVVSLLSLYSWYNRRSSIAELAKSTLTPKIDFDESMQAETFAHIIADEWGPQLYPVLKHCYEKNFTTSPESTTYKIPKIIHQIWLGSPFPEKYKKFQESWIRHHPGWEYRLWTDKDIEEFGLANKEQYRFARNYGEKSDIARYEILHRYGGVYVDTDYECLKPLDDLHKSYDFYIGIQPLDTDHVQLGLGLFGSHAGHPLLQTAIAEIGKKESVIEPVVIRTGPIFFTRVFYHIAPKLHDKTIALPASYLYPLGYCQKSYDKSVWLKPESFAVHHWEGSWLKPEAFER